MKIYVITAGDYSDYTIYGVTTDPVRAEDMRKKVSIWKHKEAEIEEFENGMFEEVKIDNIVPQRYFCVHLIPYLKPKVREFIANANKSMTCEKEEYIADCFIDEEGFPKQKIRTRYFVNYIKADDEKHAIKIACDALAEYRAKNEGIS